ncbi:MAG: class I SAM-dependent methyltransferase [Bacteroidota bacterium]|nr:class I SAM-dependent methyltransferase [Bacteroidota bacterium]
MDSYTSETMKWLDERFRLTDANGIYIAHQPIYGFRSKLSEPFHIIKYIGTYQVMKMLSHLKFDSFLDIGGAEGYKAALARELFNVKVRSCDLSIEASNRAKDIFNVDGEPTNIHKLPFKDNEFDVVLCSEVLEHVTDFEKATAELFRVCKKAVVITVPHDPKEFIENNIKNKVPHAHIHYLDAHSFDFMKSVAGKIVFARMLNPFLRIIDAIVDGMEVNQDTKYPKAFIRLYNMIAPLVRIFCGKRAAAMVVKLDDYLSNNTSYYSGMSFIILKDKDCYMEIPTKKITPLQVINFTVPLYYLNK